MCNDPANVILRMKAKMKAGPDDAEFTSSEKLLAQMSLSARKPPVTLTNPEEAIYIKAVALSECGRDGEAVRLLFSNPRLPPRGKALKFLHTLERETGQFPIEAMLAEVKREGSLKGLDHANFTGVVKIRKTKDGRGRGIFAEKDIDGGTLLMAHKAGFVIPLLSFDEALLSAQNRSRLEFWVPLRFMSLQASTLSYKMLESAHVRQLVSQLHPQVLASGTEEPPVTAYTPCPPLLSKKLKLNAYQTSDNNFGFWLTEPTYLNHSCLRNSHKVFVGDFIFVFASRDLKAGDEVTTHYHNSDWPSERARAGEFHEFTCECIMCQEDSRLSPEVRRELDAIEAEFHQLVEAESPAAKFVPLLRRLKEPRFKEHKLQPVMPELGNVALMVLRRGTMTEERSILEECLDLVVDHANLGSDLKLMRSLPEIFESRGFKELGKRVRELPERLPLFKIPAAFY